VASIEECERALQTLAGNLADAGAQTRRKADFDRTLSCRLTDPDVIFGGRLHAGTLTEIRQVDPATAAGAKIRLAMTGDDLLRLVAGELHMGSAWASGRVKVDASMLDLLKLRTVL
jgi:hypothetical protein